MFFELYSNLIKIQQHFIHGKTFFEMQEIVNKMSGVIESQLFKKVSADPHLLKMFL